MKLLWIAASFPTPFRWLSGPWNLRAMMALREYEGFDVRVICPIGLTPPGNLFKRFPFGLGELAAWRRERTDMPASGEIEGIPVYYPRWSWPPKRMFWGYEGTLMHRQIRKQVDAVIDDFKPDILHTTWVNPEGVCACHFGERHGIPVVNEGIGNDVNYYLAEFPHREHAIRNLLKAKIQVFNCQSTLREGAKVGLTHPDTRIVFHGVEVDKFVPDPDGWTSSRGIVSVGRLETRKNHQLLLRAFAMLPEDLRETASINLIGGGPLRGMLEDLGRDLGIADRVNFLGQPSHEDLVRQLQKSDVFCLPSLSEGMPVVSIEAMSCGLPVVATRVDGIPESVKEPDCGILFPNQDVDALAAALKDALTRNWDREGIRNHILNMFTWRRYAADMAAVMRDAAAGESSP